MKNVFTIALLLGSGVAVGQTASNEPALNFCGVDIAVPAGCTPDSKYELSCDKYQLSWLYLNPGQLNPVVEDMVRAERKKHKPVEQEPLEGFILDMPAKGYRLSYPTDMGMGYQLIFYGVAKGQPVVLQLTMDRDAAKTADLPAPAQQIVRLAQ